MIEKICHSIPLCFRSPGCAVLSTCPLRREAGGLFIMCCAPRGNFTGHRTKTTCLITMHLRRMGIYSGSKQAIILSDTLLGRKEEAVLWRRSVPISGKAAVCGYLGLRQSRRLQFLGKASGSYVGKSKYAVSRPESYQRDPRA